ncbi:MAG: glycogen synthase [Ekhidna sp.]|nr:glycogen synthase [Ekhidna sp.]
MTKQKKVQKRYLVETAWEVCNQVGGIYTVIRSKVPAAKDQWDKAYTLLGPYLDESTVTDVELLPPDDSLAGKAVKRMQEMGYHIHFGTWLVSGRPTVVLLDIHAVMHKLGDIKYFYYQSHHIQFDDHNYLLDQVMAFGYLVKIFISEITRLALEKDTSILAHFHEWMAGTAIPDLRKEQVPARLIFTTHATILGRYLAMNDAAFYDHLPFLDWRKEAQHFNIGAVSGLERACAHGSHIFTTVSQVTGKECLHLLGRSPDHVLPNGFNVERYNVLHEVQNVHQNFKSMIQRFVMGHFFQSYAFDLDKTLFFFTSGRYEYQNKGYDMTLEALARLNWRLKQERAKETVVMFIVTKRPVHSVNPNVLNSRAMMEEVERNCDSIVQQLKERLFLHAATNEQDHRVPPLNEFVDDYWKLRYRRTIRSWKSGELPGIVTHNMHDDSSDDVLNYLRNANLLNHKDDRVKFVYHPEFISSSNPLFRMEYGDFVRGCHLGIFPSNYEPWGYTPLECLVRGVATVTSDLAGFGDYSKNIDIADEDHGLFVVERSQKDYHAAADDLANILYRVVKTSRKERIAMRNRCEDLSERFDWSHLYMEYMKSYDKAMEQLRIAV